MGLGVSIREGQQPPLEDITLDKLEKWLSDINAKFPNTADYNLDLKSISFDKTYNVSLGLPPNATDESYNSEKNCTAGTMHYTVFSPGRFLLEDQFKKPTPYLSPSQDAFIQVLTEGLKRDDTNSILIDVATLAPAPEYFTSMSDDGRSVIGERAKAVDMLKQTAPNKEVTIRLLVGDQSSAKLTDNKSPSFQDRFEKMRKRYEDIFWNSGQPSQAPQDLANVKHFVERVLNQSIGLIKPIAGFIGRLDIDAIVDKIMTNSQPSITWNHGKILAVNGETLMTGAMNYWQEYSRDGNHDVCDTSAKLRGDAAVSAHKWADYFWSYLEKPTSSDSISVWAKANLAAPIDGNTSIWIQTGTIPKSADFRKGVTTSKLQTLTVARLGDWYGGMKSLRYPVQIIDALRDVLLNLAWEWLAPTAEKNGMIFWAKAQSFADDTLTAAEEFQNLGINPVAWATRYARTQAIAYANHSVVVSQQMLVDTDAMNQLKSAVAGKINTNWDGSLWPFDLLIALAQALGNMSRSTSVDPNPSEFQKDSKGVYIVLSNYRAGSFGYGDNTLFSKVKKRLRIIMQNLPFGAGGIPLDQIDAALKMLHFKRTDDTTANQCLLNHSKIVCVDRSIMYVGSDNAYPAYNEEHGIWIDDKASIDDWLTNNFTDFWKACKIPADA